MKKKTHFIVHHRFHDNIACLIETLQGAGYSTRLFVILRTNTETYDLVDPVVSPNSSLSGLWRKIVKKPLMAYLPSVRSVYKEYKQERPDYVLLRPFISGIGFVHFVCALWFCKKIVLYSQSPKFRAGRFKNDLFLRMVLSIPKTHWMTPVKYRDEQALEKKLTPHRKISYLQLPHRKVKVKTDWFQGDKLNILLIAKAQSYKNHGLLLEALSGLSKEKYRLIIAGDYSGKDAYTQKVLHQLEDFKIHFELLGYVDHKKINELYERSDLMVLPSSYEMHGYVVNEAIAYGVPVVVSSATGTKSLVKHGENGFIFKNRDAEDLKGILLDLMENRDTLKEMSLACQNVYEEELSTSGFIKKYNGMLGASSS